MNAPEPYSGPFGADDPLLEQAIAIVRNNKRASISLVQRHLRIGYNRAAHLLEGMEKRGIVKQNATPTGGAWTMV